MFGVRLGVGLGRAGQSRRGLATSFSALSLFSGGEKGVIFDPSPDTCFTDTGGTTPAGVGDAVAFMLDTSGNGNHATAADDTRKPILKQDASGKYYLDFDGSTNFLEFTNGVLGSSDHTVIYAAHGATETETVINLGNIGTPYSHRSFSTEIGLRITGGAETYNNKNTTLAIVTHILTGTLTTDNRAYRNGVELAPVSENAGSTLTTTSEGHIGQGSVGAVSDISFYGAAVINRAATDTERHQSEDYFRAKAGIASFQDVFLLAGQSNMAGRAPFDNGALWPSGTSEWLQNDTLSSVTGSALDHPNMDPANMGLDIGFARAFNAAKPNSSLLLVPHAIGSTGFNDGDWNPTDPRYVEAVARTNAALASVSGSRLRGILWLQGEQDSLSTSDTTESSHASALDAMIAGMRADIDGASNVPFILGQIPFISGTFFDKQEFVRAAIADTPNRLSNIGFADNTSLTKLNDGLHYDAASLRIMGQRMFEAFNGLS